MSETLDSVVEFLKLLKSWLGLIFGIAAISALLVFPADGWLPYDLDEIRKPYRGYLFLAFLFATILFVARTSSWAVAKGAVVFNKWNAARKGKLDRENRLTALSPASKKKLKELLATGQKVHRLDANDTTVVELFNTEVLYRPQQVTTVEFLTGKVVMPVNYEIQPWAADTVRENPKVLTLRSSK